MGATLLQAGSQGIVQWILSHLPLVIFLAAAILPSLTSARRRQEQASRRPTPPSPWSGRETPQPPPADLPLDERVRRYFAETPPPGPSAPNTPHPAARPMPRSPVVPPPRPPAAEVPPSLFTAIESMQAGGPSSPMQLQKAHRRSALHRTRALGSEAPHKLRLDRQTLRNAVLLREILGPPKALE